MIRELVVVGAAAVVILVLALWRLGAAALAELDGLTVEDDGERM
jgi:hypothetical protein